jgi:predicted nucleic acid-binding protein
MAVKVVDASALGALLFGEPYGAAIAERLQRLRGAELIAPALLPFEVANICVRKMRRHPE